MRQRCAVTVACLLHVMLAVAEAQSLTPALDAARLQPIVEGERAAGVQLGDDEVQVTSTLGPPTRVDENAALARKELIYTADDGADWSLAIRIVFTSREVGVEAIHVNVSHRASVETPYRGATSRGYRLGEPQPLAQALYGSPDVVLRGSATGLDLWWYTQAGILIFPGERVSGEVNETKVVVVNPHLSPAEIMQLIGEP